MIENMIEDANSINKIDNGFHRSTTSTSNFKNIKQNAKSVNRI